jgi:spermidine synthase
MFNADILKNPKVEIFVNDGRHHLLMQQPNRYDLITLESPPVVHAGVSSLYTKEFYHLARSRLGKDGYITQWLPIYQLSEKANLSLVRAFVEVFPDSAMLSGFGGDLILMGKKGHPFVLDIDRVDKNLADAPQVLRDLERIHMGTLTDIVGSYASSGQTLARVSQHSKLLEDDFPIIEYSIHSNYVGELGIPRQLFDVSQANQWCPKCFTPVWLSGKLADLPAYLKYMGKVYSHDAFLHSKMTIRKKGIQIEPFQDLDDHRLMEKYPYLRFFYWKKRTD